MSLFVIKDGKIVPINKENKTVVILDWDDTLFPSTYLAINQYLEDLTKVIKIESEMKKFKRLEEYLLELFSKLLIIGDVYIVTNSDAGWVELSCSMFYPLLLPLISKIKIISGKTKFELTYPKQLVKWKELAFEECTLNILYNINVNKNFIIVGDSETEHQAVKNLITKTVKDIQKIIESINPNSNNDDLHHSFQYKSIKFIDQPFFEDLEKQVKYLINEIVSIKNYSKNKYYDMSKILHNKEMTS
jgi:hypothetical protein